MPLFKPAAVLVLPLLAFVSTEALHIAHCADTGSVEISIKKTTRRAATSIQGLMLQEK